MSGRKSLDKGKRFERETAKILTSTTGVPWHRVPNSGAMSTTQNLQDNKFKGDMFTEHKDYQDIMIECKSVNHFVLLSLFSPKSQVWAWMRKLETQPTSWTLLIKIRKSGVIAISPNTNLLKQLFPNHKWEHVMLIDAKYALIKIK